MKTSSRPYLSQENGNALWFILLAIVLLGALTLLITRTGSSVDQTGSREQTEIRLSQIMRYAKSLEAATQKLLLSGCSENEINFDISAADTTYDNGNSPPGNVCHIFEPEGAGLKWQTFPGGTTIAGGEFTTQGISTDASISGIGSNTAREILFVVSVSDTMCGVINAKFGIDDTDPNDIRSNSLDVMDQSFGGTIPNSAGVLLGAGIDAPGIAYKSSGCFVMDTGDPLFYHVLHAR